jgi:hypothetical protein
MSTQLKLTRRIGIRFSGTHSPILRVHGLKGEAY